MSIQAGFSGVIGPTGKTLVRAKVYSLLLSEAGWL